MTEESRRFEIRYGVERWKDSRWFIIWLVLVLVVFSVFFRPRNQPLAVLLIPSIEAIVIGTVYLGGLYIFRRLSYLELTADGLLIRYGLVSLLLPYSAISRVRRQPLDVAFAAPERRRYKNRFTRRLGREPAIYIRLDRRQDDLLAQVQRRLNPRFVLGNDIVVPLSDSDGFLNAVKPRIRAG